MASVARVLLVVVWMLVCPWKGACAATDFIETLADKQPQSVVPTDEITSAFAGAGQEVVSLVIKAHEQDSVSFVQAVAGLRAIGEAALKPLRQIARDDSRDSYTRRVAICVIGNSPPTPESEKLLVELLASTDEVVRLEAITSAGYIKAKSAVPKLVSLLDEKDEYLLRSTVESLSRIGNESGVAVSRLVEVLDSPGVAGSIADSIVDALGEIRSRAEIAVPALARQLKDSGRTWSAALALSKYGEAARPARQALEEALLDNRETGMVSEALTAIGPDSIPSLEKALYLPDASTRKHASDGLASFGSRAIPVFLRFLEHEHKNAPEYQVLEATDGLSRVGAPALGALRELINPESRPARIRTSAIIAVRMMRGDKTKRLKTIQVAFRDPDSDVRFVAVTAVEDFGSAASLLLDDLISALTDDSDSVRAAAANSIAVLGPDAERAVAVLIGRLSDSDSAVRENSATALGDIGHYSLPALPVLRRQFRDDEVHEEAMSASLQIISSLSDHKAELSRDDLNKAIEESSKTRVSFAQLPASAADADVILASVRNLKTEAGRRDSDMRAKWFRWTALCLGFVLVIGGASSASMRVRRLVLVARGYRWRLRAHRSPIVFSISGNEAPFEVRLICDRSHALTPIQVDPESGHVSDQSVLERMRNEGSGSDIRMETTEAAFARLWAQWLGYGWSGDEEVTVAGQVLVSRDAPPDDVEESRLSFRGLGCSRAANNSVILPSVDLEVYGLSSVFSSFGASTADAEGASAFAATIADTVSAFSEADIMHVSAHATPDRIQLADGDLTLESLQGVSIRCRLLVLSACRAGDIESGNSLVKFLVWSGVNVLASAESLDQAKARIFFEMLYREFLPKKNTTGPSVAQAIRLASKTLRERSQGDDDFDMSQGRWRRCLDSLVLFGEPTLRIEFDRYSGVYKATAEQD